MGRSRATLPPLDTHSAAGISLQSENNRRSRKVTMRLNCRTLFTGLLAACMASGCADTGTAAWQMIMHSIKPPEAAAGAALNPAHQYKRISMDGRSLFLALGDRDHHPDGLIEVYYSSGREVLRFQNGRVVGAAGLLTEWRNVSVQKMPQWAAVAHAAGPVSGERIRDVMPGYRYGIHDRLVVSRIAPPANTRLLNLNANALTWFEERHEISPVGGNTNLFFKPAMPAESLPPARYAVDFSAGGETVVYAEQCLAPGLCFTWQRWAPGKP
jgi:hypothetical protein